MQLPAGRSSPSHARLTRSCRGPGRPVGELDLATVGIVDAELADLWAVGFSSLVLDLRGSLPRLDGPAPAVDLD
jgi:hypothetical protein